MPLLNSGEKAAQARILRGRDGWWYLGTGGAARLKAAHLTGEGALNAAAAQFLEARGLNRPLSYRFYSLTVLTSTDCNLGCGYCFQNTAQDPTGGTRPPRIAHARLTSETISRILGFAEQRMASAGLDKLSIMLFGGEPLLNPRGCVELLARAADYGLDYAWMVSNGTLLTVPVATQLAQLGLKEIQITFDGDRPQHDLIRVRRSGGGTFDAIIDNIARVSAATDIRWHLRVNVSHHNRDGVPGLIDRIAQATDPRRCQLNLARVGDAGVGYANDLAYGSAEADRFLGFYRHAMDLGFKVLRPVVRNECQTCMHPDGRYGAVVSADGMLSSCWDTAGRPDWTVGTIDSGYLPAAEVEDRWVACGHQYAYADGAAVAKSFDDAVDAGILDELSSRGLL